MAGIRTPSASVSPGPTHAISNPFDAVMARVQLGLGTENRSVAHGLDHLDRVARRAGIIVGILGGSERQQQMAQVGGLMHDVVKSLGQNKRDEELSALKAARILGEVGVFTPEEIQIVCASVRTDTVPGSLLSTPKKDDPAYFEGENLVRIAVWFADKLESNGAFGMARRSQFVGGERLCKKGGDLRELRERLERRGHSVADSFNSTFVVIGESYRWLRVKNRRGLYPEWSMPVINDLFERQFEFYYALLASMSLTEDRLAAVLKKVCFPGISEEALRDAERRRPNTAEAISLVSEEQIEAAKEVVMFFSSPESSSVCTADAVRTFRPKTTVAMVWHKEMLDYLDGNPLDRLNQLSTKASSTSAFTGIERP